MKKLNSFNRIILKLRFLFIPDGRFGDARRGELYAPFFKKSESNLKVATQVFFYNPNKISVGKNVYIGFNSYVGEGDLELEDEVIIGNFVSITPSNHLRKNNSYRFGGHKAEKIKIGRGTWLGGSSVITAGVEIGSGCIVAAGSVVTKSFGDNLVIGGIPAKIIKKID